MHIFTTLLLLTCSVFAFGKSVSVDTTFTIYSVGTTSVCGNDSVQLYSVGCSGVVNWSNGISNQPSVYIKQSGDYFATCVATNTKSNTYNVSIFPQPSAPVVTLQNINNQYVLEATGCNDTIIWSNGTTGQSSITVNTDGIYYAQCQFLATTSCISSASNIINIANIAIPQVSTDKTALCTAERATLTATGCLGILHWSNGDTGSSIQVTLDGNYYAYCEENGNFSLNSDTLQISRIELLTPMVLSPINTYCLNPTTTLTAYNCQGTIIWNNGATTSSITVAEAGTYSAQCQNQCGTSNQSNVITIQQELPPAAPVISTTKTIMCDGESATLTATGCLGTVLWSTNATTNSIQLIVSGTYTAICKNQCGQSGPSNSIVLRASSLPTFPTISSNKAVLCNNETATLVATNCNGNLLWNNGMTTSTIQVSQAGNYTVTCNNICGATGSQPFVISNSSIIIVPPTITTNKASICNNEIATLSSTGCLGTVVWSNGATGISAQVSKGGAYTALCQNACGTSANSNSLTITQLSSQCTPITIRKLR